MPRDSKVKTAACHLQRAGWDGDLSSAGSDVTWRHSSWVWVVLYARPVTDICSSVAWLHSK